MVRSRVGLPKPDRSRPGQWILITREEEPEAFRTPEEQAELNARYKPFPVGNAAAGLAARGPAASNLNVAGDDEVDEEVVDAEDEEDDDDDDDEFDFGAAAMEVDDDDDTGTYAPAPARRRITPNKRRGVVSKTAIAASSPIVSLLFILCLCTMHGGILEGR